MTRLLIHTIVHTRIEHRLLGDVRPGAKVSFHSNAWWDEGEIPTRVGDSSQNSKLW